MHRLSRASQGPVHGVPFCQLCGQLGGLLQQCSRCKMVHYCSDAHQRDDFRYHLRACYEIEDLMDLIDTEGKRLRDYPGDESVEPGNLFETAHGSWGDLEATQDYLEAQEELFSVLKAMHPPTQDALKSAVDRLFENERLGSENDDDVDFAPGLLLRLGLDQRCYDHLRDRHGDYLDRTASIDGRSTTSSGQPHQYTAYNDPGPLEPNDFKERDKTHLTTLVALCLLKLRLHLDVSNLANFKDAMQGSNLPTEITHLICGWIPITDIVKDNRSLMHSEPEPLKERALSLASEVSKLIDDVAAMNGHYWPMLLMPHQNHRPAKSTFHCAAMDSPDRAMMTWHSTNEAWIESPDAFVKLVELDEYCRTAQRPTEEDSATK